MQSIHELLTEYGITVPADKGQPLIRRRQRTTAP